MTIESNYYENVDFWRQGALLPEDMERMRHVSTAIPQQSRSVLDVGCGNGEFLRYLASARRDIDVLYGAERSRVALEFVSVAKTQASIDSLPFADRSFECVTCLEVIEHLPQPIYSKAISELMRVCDRRLIISVPNAQDLSLGRVECPACSTLFNPDYHLRSFDEASMRNLVDPDVFKVASVEVFGESREYMCSRLITRLKGSTGNRFPQDLPCPACGCVLPGRKDADLQPVVKVTSGSGVRGMVKYLWPKVREFRWILATYERIA